MSDAYIDVATLQAELALDPAPTVIDVRGQEEYTAGHIPGALRIPGDVLARRLAEVPYDRPVVTY